jgi:hypothetical protein
LKTPYRVARRVSSSSRWISWRGWWYRHECSRFPNQADAFPQTKIALGFTDLGLAKEFLLNFGEVPSAMTAITGVEPGKKYLLFKHSLAFFRKG